MKIPEPFVVKLTCLLAGMLLLIPVYGQFYVQLERTGTLRTIRYSPGDVLTFRLVNDDKGWYDRMITSIDVKGNRIIFPDVVVPVDSIESILLDKKAVGAKIIGGALQGGGINMILFSAYYAIFRDTSLDWTAVLSGVANIGIGMAITRLFRHKEFRIGSRKRIRLLDLNFTPPGT